MIRRDTTASEARRPTTAPGTPLRILLIGGKAEARLREILRAGVDASVVVERVEDVATATARLAGSVADVALVDTSVLEESPASDLADIDIPLVALVEHEDGGAARVVIEARALRLLRLDRLEGDAVLALLRSEVERHRLRGEVDTAERRFCDIVERTADGIVLVGPAGEVRFVNPAAERLFGRNSDDLLGKPFGFSIVTGETTEIDVLRRGGETVVAELRVVETTWEGEPAQLLAIRDITERKRAEERARSFAREQAAREAAEAAERRWRFLAQVSEVLASTFDYRATLSSLARLAVPTLGDRCMIHIAEGDGLRRLVAASADPAREQPLPPLQHHARSAVLRVLRTGEAELVRAAVDGGKHSHIPEAERHDLLRELSASSVVFVPMLAHGRALGVITLSASDVDRGHMDAALDLAFELAHRAAQALESARLYEEARAASQAKSDFLAIMSHELRTPLNAILGYADLMLLGVPHEISEEPRGQVMRIGLSARHLLELIDEILNFSQLEARREQVRIETVDAACLVNEVVAAARPLALEKGLDLEVELPAGPLVLETDGEKLSKVVLNLLSNAVKFTDEGGVHVSATLEGDRLELHVSDTGIGIPPEHLEGIFEPFRQVEHPTTRRWGGTGLGLTVSRRLARLLGGEVSVESTPGAGATFTLTLPCRPPARTPAGS